MSVTTRSPLGTAFMLGRETPAMMTLPEPTATPETPPSAASVLSPELARALSEVKGQAQFLLYLADQIEDSLEQLVSEGDDRQTSFLCKLLTMYSAQLETKHQGLGDKIAETCQEVYVTVREFDAV